MAITFLEQKKKQKYLILIAVLIIFLILAIIWRQFLLKPKPSTPPEVVKPPKIEINFSILKNPILKELQLFEEIPAPEEKIGRENPFLLY